MDLTFSQQDRAFQQEVRDWLSHAWPQEMRDKQARSALGKLSKEDLVGWQKRLAEKGWAERIGQKSMAAQHLRQPRTIFLISSVPG